MLIFWILISAFAQADTYFKDNYIESRRAFRHACSIYTKKAIHVESQVDHDLTIDTCFIPAKKPKNLLILTSGIHGAEGPVGSAVQTLFLKELAPNLDRNETSVLLIHAVNPFGFKFERRVNESNVDLNRNFESGAHLFEIENQGYAKVEKFLNPKSPAVATGIADWFFPVKAVYYIARYSLRTLREAVVRGQYNFPKGLFFGGANIQRETVAVAQLLSQPFIDTYQNIVSISLHTGYGERGRLHLIAPNVPDEAVRSRTKKLFVGHPIDYPETKDFYKTNGDFEDYLLEKFPKKNIIPVAFEFGTLDSQKVSGSIRSIHNMVLENQGFHFGYASDKDREESKRRFKEMFYPSSEEWRASALQNGKKVLLDVLSQIGK